MICYICKLYRNRKTMRIPAVKQVKQKDGSMIKVVIGWICKVCIKKAAKLQRRLNEQRKAVGVTAKPD